MRTRLIFFIVAVLSLTISPTSLTSNAAPNPIEIISIAEVSCTSVEILFDSNVAKKSLSYYVISAVVDDSVVMPKNIKKVIKTKATGLITAEIKNLNPKAAYNFSVSAKTNKGKMINSKVVKYLSVCNLMDLLSNLPADWGNPKPIQLPTPAPTTAPIAIPAFTLSSSTETRTVNTAATGFPINSTGGAIASFAINATPPNMSFNTTTGALTGTPNTIAGATAYTITATNATGSATQTFTLTVTAVVYIVGQTGPGGGKVFYVSDTAFACGPTRAASCTYLEAAPGGWMIEANARTTWAKCGGSFCYKGTTVPGDGATATEIGWGYRNTRAIIAQGNDNSSSSAAALAVSYTVTVSGVVYNDWFLSSKDELNLLYLQQAVVGGLAKDYYWSSSESSATNAWLQLFTTGVPSDTPKDNTRYVRPVRAF
jgi:hypothetical protein